MTRDTLNDLAKERGLKVEEGKYLPAELMKAGYAFFCGTAAEVAGIESVNRIPFRTN
ncbi:MAG: aminotransferase class IV [Bacteroidia bacterium]